MRPVTPQTAQPAARVGRPSRYDVASSELLQIRVTPNQRLELKRIATEYGTNPTALVRDAIDQAIGDYGEGCLFLTVGTRRS